MSKRVMAEVTCTAQDLGVPIYYTDTDSLQIEESGIPAVAAEYERLYDRPLIGKNLGQFHNDYDSESIKKNLRCEEGYFLGKKVYLCELHGQDDKDKDAIDYHTRMKGVNLSAIKYHTENGMSLMATYQYLFNEEENEIVFDEDFEDKGYSTTGIGFDIACGGKKCAFNYNADFTINNRTDFVRNVKLPQIRHIADEDGNWIDTPHGELMHEIRCHGKYNTHS